MNQIKAVIGQMIDYDEEEMAHFLSSWMEQKLRRKSMLSSPGKVPSEVFFIKKAA